MKILSLFLAFSLLVSSCPLSAQGMRPRLNVKADMSDDARVQLLQENASKRAEELKRNLKVIEEPRESTYYPVGKPPLTLEELKERQRRIAEQARINNFIQESGSYYDAYLEALSHNPDVPELTWPAESVRNDLNAEANRLVEKINENEWAVGGEKRKNAIDIGLEIVYTVFAMSLAGKGSAGIGARSTNNFVVKNYGRLGGLASFSAKGGSRLSRAVLGGPWKGYGQVLMRQVVLDMAVFSLAMEPLMVAYENLIPRLASAKYLEDMEMASQKVNELLLAWDQLNESDYKDAQLLDYNGQQIQTGEPDELGWYNEDAKHNHIVLLYALRYLNNYIRQSDDKWRDELVLLELLNLSLPYGAMYESINNVTLTGNPGRLFFDYEREEIIRLLKSPAMQWEWTELKECSLGNVMLSNNQVETNSDAFKYATCVKEQYMQMRSNPDAARAAEHTI